MIADKIERAHLYEGLSTRIAKGLELIRDPVLAAEPDGKYEIEGDDIFALVTRYTTKPQGEIPFEAHRRYIDIQAILDGQEIIGWAHTEELEVLTPYVHDIVELTDPPDFSEIKLRKGMFAIFFPSDAHKPCCDYAGRQTIHKLVIKIRA